MKKLIMILTATLFISSISFGQSDSLIVFHGEVIYRDTVALEMFLFVPGQTKVKVIERGERYYKIIYGDKIGWVLKTRLFTESENIKLIEEQKAKRKAEELAKKQAETRARQDALKAKQAREKAQMDALNKKRADFVKKYGSQEIADKIVAKKIWLGMTDRMAVDSWGIPVDINKTVGSWGVHEQWVYGDKYLYFENGVLTSWQE